MAFIIAMDITLYKHPIYGEFTFADEFKIPKKYKYKDINFADFIEDKLVGENYIKYDSELDFIKGFYYYKSMQKNHYSIILFINQEITKKYIKILQRIPYAKSNYLKNIIIKLRDKIF